MAKNRDTFTFDDDDWDSDFNFGDDGGFESTSKRSKARKAVSEFGGSFISGVKQSLLNSDNHRRILRRNAPKEFLTVYDGVSTGARAVGDIYDNTKKTFLDGVGDVSALAPQVEKIGGKLIPQRLRDKLVSGLESTKKYSSYSEEEENKNELDNIMSGIVDQQRRSAVLQDMATQDSTTKIVAGQISTTSAVLTTGTIMSHVGANTDVLVNLGLTQAKLTRKNVELAYSQSITQRKILDVLEQTRSLQVAAFGDLVKNTSLPDHVKATTYEEVGKSLRDKLVGMATARVTSRVSDLTGNIFSKARQGLAHSAEQLGSGASLMSTMGGMVGGSGMSKMELIAPEIGSMLANLLLDRGSKAIGSKVKDDPEIKVYGDAISNLLSELPGRWDEAMNSGGKLSTIANLLGVGDVRSTKNMDTSVRRSAMDSYDRGEHFSRLTNLSITEVIPGHLSGMKATLKSIAERLGVSASTIASNEDTYDHEKATFVLKSELASVTRDRLFDKGHMKATSEAVDRIMQSLDTEGELKGKARNDLRKYLLKMASSGSGYVDPSKLKSSDPDVNPLAAYGGDSYLEVATVLSGTHNFGGGESTGRFKNLNDNVGYQKRLKSANKGLEELRYAMPVGMQHLTSLAGTGNMDVARASGMMSWDDNSRAWKFDLDKYIASLASGEAPTEQATPKAVANTSPLGNLPPLPTPTDLGVGGDLLRVATEIRDKIVGRDELGEIITGSASIGSTGTVGTGSQEVVDAIERNSPAALVAISNQLLEAIRTRLEMGIPTHAGGDEMPQRRLQVARMFRSMLTNSTKMLSKGGSMASNIAMFGVRNIFKPVKLVGGVVASAASVAGKVGSGLVSALTSRGSEIIEGTSNQFKKAKNLLGDIYVNGSDEVLIKLADLKAGKYFDAATGKVIKAFKDIKGAIVDADNNTILSQEQYESGIYTKIKGKSTSIVNGILSSGFNMLKGGVKLGFNVNMIPIRVAGAVGKYAIGKLKWSGDIYVAGEKSPRLLASILRAGGYFNANGKPIRKLSDIVGDIYDANGEVILKVSDMAKGLVDKSGKPVKGLMDRVVALAKLPYNIVKGAWSGVVGAATGMASLFKRDKKGGGGDGVSEDGVDRIVTSIDRIHQLLDDRLERPKGSWYDKDGSGHRDGSREDQEASREAERNKQDIDKARSEDASQDRKGILGTLMSLVGGIGAVLGTVKAWFGNIFGLMRSSMMMRLANSGMNLGTSLLNVFSKGKAGKVGKAAGAAGTAMSAGKMAKMGAALSKMAKSPVFRGAAIGAGILGIANTTFASNMMRGASDALSQSDAQAYKDNYIDMDDSSAESSTDSGSPTDKKRSWLGQKYDSVKGWLFGDGGDENGDGGRPSAPRRFLNTVGGSVLGEMAAIAALPAMLGGYDKLAQSKLGQKIKLPGLPQAGEVSADGKTSALKRVGNFFMRTTPGRLIGATALGVGGFGVRDALGSDPGEDLGTETMMSAGTTLGLEAAALGGIPLGIMGYNKFKDWRDRKKRLATADKLKSANFTPGNVQSTPYLNRGTSSTPAPATVSTPPLDSPAKPKLTAMQRVTGAGRGILKNAGILGTGLALYDAAGTEGGAWDKTKAFGSSLLQNAAIGKAFSVGGKLLTKGGRAEAVDKLRGMSGKVKDVVKSRAPGAIDKARTLMQGGKKKIAQNLGKEGLKRLISTAGRQAAWQGVRTAAVAGASALAGVVSAPVLLGAAAVAAVGGAAYLGYKYFSAKDNNSVARYRLAQYGINPSDKDKASLLAKLEMEVKKHLSVTGDKVTYSSAMNIYELMSIFGISQSNAKRTESFVKWFTGRFKPLYSNSVAAMMKVAGNRDIEKADALNKADKSKIMDILSSVDEAAYKVVDSPFADGKDLEGDPESIKGELTKSNKAIEKEKGTEEESKGGASPDGDGLGTKVAKALGFVGGSIWEQMKNAGKFGLDLAKNIATGNFGGAVDSVKQFAINTVNNAGNVVNKVRALSGNNREKYKSIRDAAISAGDPHPDIVAAQWALESGWGKKQSGKNNYFGIKATSGQEGTTVRTREVVNGKSVWVNAKFADYGSLEEGIAARVEFIRSNPRYTKAGYYTAKTPREAAQALQSAGYATDPKYAKLLCDIISGAGYDPDKPSDVNPSDSTTANLTGAPKKETISPVGTGTVLRDPSVNGLTGGMTPPTTFTQPPQASVVDVAKAAIDAASPVIGMSKNHRAVKAATYATQKANAKSIGYCARYVANALLHAGYKFERQPSAYMYANGTLEGAGFKKVAINGQFQIGDVMVWSAYGGSKGGGKHGHIQIYNGRNWVSDFVQRTVVPGRSYSKSTPSLWRDATLIGTHVSGVVDVADKAKVSSGEAGDTKEDEGNIITGNNIPPTIARPTANTTQSLTDTRSTPTPMGSVDVVDRVSSFFRDSVAGVDSVANTVTVAAQTAYGTVKAWVGGDKSKKSHELALTQACINSGITNPTEVAMFLAQCAHETGGFKWLKELGKDSYFAKYNGRKDLGNGPNDGARYKGRGYIHLTGRANYTAFSRATGIDAVGNPDQVEKDLNVAARSATWWWTNNPRARKAAQAGDVRATTKAVNGGYNGLEDRTSKWNYYKGAIGNDLNKWLVSLGGDSDATSATTGGSVATSAESAPMNTGSPVSAAQAAFSAGMVGAGVIGGVSAGAALMSDKVGAVEAPEPMGLMGVPKDHRAVKAATYATQKANAKSIGYCARYVANALQHGGYKFERQPSAYMYANGILANAGFTKIQNNGKYQIGDVMVWSAYGGNSGGGKHGHIQIYNGRNWVSDFVQRTVVPGRSYSKSTPSLWRDSTLMGKEISGEVPNIDAAKSVSDEAAAPKEDSANSPTTAISSPNISGDSGGSVVPVSATSMAQVTQGPSDIIAPKLNPEINDSIAEATSRSASMMGDRQVREMVGIQSRQLEVQVQMLATLKDIKADISNISTGAARAAETPAQNTTPTQPNRNTNFREALGQFGIGGGTGSPVSMRIKV